MNNVFENFIHALVFIQVVGWQIVLHSLLVVLMIITRKAGPVLLKPFVKN